MQHLRNIGAHLLSKIGVVPAARTAGATNGTGINRLGHQSCVLAVKTGASSGTPDSFTVAGKLQHSADNSKWADYTDPITGNVVAITALAAANSIAEVDADLSGAKLYIRAVVTAAFVGGTTPAINCDATILLGGSAELPV